MVMETKEIREENKTSPPPGGLALVDQELQHTKVPAVTTNPPDQDTMILQLEDKEDKDQAVVEQVDTKTVLVTMEATNTMEVEVEKTEIVETIRGSATTSTTTVTVKRELEKEVIDEEEVMTVDAAVNTTVTTTRQVLEVVEADTLAMKMMTETGTVVIATETGTTDTTVLVVVEVVAEEETEDQEDSMTDPVGPPAPESVLTPNASPYRLKPSTVWRMPCKPWSTTSTPPRWRTSSSTVRNWTP